MSVDTDPARTAEAKAKDVGLRHAAIVTLAREEGRVSVDGLANHFGVTPQTIRKDLNELAAQRKVTRVHGGAIPASGTVNVEYDKRRLIAMEQKAQIGVEAAALIPAEASVFLSIGTTSEAVSAALTDHPGLLVVTNNLNVASRLRPSAQHEVIVAGGVVRPTDGGIVGASTADFLRQFRVDYALVGTSAIDADGGIYDFDLREVNVLRAIIENARAAILVADSTKFARRAPIRVAGLADFDVFVTDEAPVSIAQLCRACRCELIQTKASD